MLPLLVTCGNCPDPGANPDVEKDTEAIVLRELLLRTEVARGPCDVARSLCSSPLMLCLSGPPLPLAPCLIPRPIPFMREVTVSVRAQVLGTRGALMRKAQYKSSKRIRGMNAQKQSRRVWGGKTCGPGCLGKS